LKNNCVTSTEIWLGIRKKGARRPGIGYEDAVREALCFGWIDGKMKSVNEELYVLRFSPRRKNSVWSRANRRRAEELIEAGKMEQPGFEAMSNSHRLMYVRWVLEARRPQTRERRIAEVLRRAERNLRPGEQ
jgi:uncharacterized protein YdeI (YjbR/CyaY-like superfamily)